MALLRSNALAQCRVNEGTDFARSVTVWKKEFAGLFAVIAHFRA
jgi:hypothetical protein